ncbi:hypothetical protein [Nocardia altamirensis]|uniref:hypothetical protein n=1 Tax=Nocardia altamirensis TaxID=472158 RepID=UPI0008402B1D|nr:hypothetical protein [Nocardia altamirensis]
MAEPEQSEGAQMEAAVARWQTLKKQAEGGELRLDEQVGTELANHADQMRTKLNKILNDASELDRLSGFGTLKSAEALRGKFERKANGGNDSAMERLKQSIDVVTLMSETYKLAIGKLTESDQSAAAQYSKLNTGDS